MPATADRYQDIRSRMAHRSRQESDKGRDAGPIPPIVDEARRESAAGDFRLFCETYLAGTFHSPWSVDHPRVLAKIETAVQDGGLFAMAMPRGAGKTSLCVAATLWATLYGHRPYVALIGASAGAAERLLTWIKTELRFNVHLFEDFPEICQPVRELNNSPARCAMQHVGGTPTSSQWSADVLVYPYVEIDGKPRPGASARIQCQGLLGDIRGMIYQRPDGRPIRPSLAIVDDPQTDSSARSPAQCQKRLSIMTGAVLGLAGPGAKIAGVVPCTVIRPGDVADSILDREKHPEYRGERTRLVYSFPEDSKLVEEYRAVWRADHDNDGDGTEPRKWWRERKAELWKGVKLAWPDRTPEGCEDELQYCLNLLIDRGEAAFWAEYQNEPTTEVEPAKLTAEQIAAKASSLKRGAVPRWATQLTAFVDVQLDSLWWMLCAWNDSFRGHVVDYGVFPKQRKAAKWFQMGELRQTLATKYRKLSEEARWRAGLEELTVWLCGRRKDEDGKERAVDRLLIDASFGRTTELIYEFCGQSKLPIAPAHGQGIGANNLPYHAMKRKVGEKIGRHWKLGRNPNRPVQHYLIDSNYWKSFVFARLACGEGDPANLSLFDDDHDLLADHLLAERCDMVEVESRGRKVEEWSLLPSRMDNHWLDCLYGCAAAASVGGSELAETGEGRSQPTGGESAGVFL